MGNEEGDESLPLGCRFELLSAASALLDTIKLFIQIVRLKKTFSTTEFAISGSNFLKFESLFDGDGVCSES